MNNYRHILACTFLPLGMMISVSFAKTITVSSSDICGQLADYVVAMSMTENEFEISKTFSDSPALCVNITISDQINIDLPSEVHCRNGLIARPYFKKVYISFSNESRLFAVGNIQVSCGESTHTIFPGQTVEFYLADDNGKEYRLKGIATVPLVAMPIPYTVTARAVIGVELN
ncbi:MAG: hypothetical protein JSW54_07960 [Fidelibacterota bacterium]|nr:MAG: hypothetical protein JSW54_07960 [Candidatus Neomarinimicrobiota bacterium]